MEVEMKSTINTFAKNALLTLFAALVFTNLSMGQTEKAPKPLFKENAIKNLIVAIKSENEGLRKSGIYFAGLYEIKEAVETLVEEFKNEKNPKIRVLIALSLYRIGDEKGMESIYTAALHDNDSKVKRICIAIANEYNTGKAVITLTKQL
jgi:hypothetical protein